MRYLFIIFLFISALGFGQSTDNFDSYADGSDLDAAANWVAIVGGTSAVKVYVTGGDGEIYGWVSTEGCVMYSGTFNNDQYSQAVASATISGKWMTLQVRCSGSGATANYYGWGSDATGSYFFKCVNGVHSYPTVYGNAWIAGHTYKLEVVGTELRFYNNGSLETSIDGDGKYTDASLSSGNPGVGCYGASVHTARLDSWEGGNVGGSALAGGTIAADQSIAYNADPAAFTSSAAASGGTGVYTYKWQWSTSSITPGGAGWNDISSSNSTTYNETNLTTTVHYVRQVNDGSNIAYSNVLTITVAAPASAKVYPYVNGVKKYPYVSGVKKYMYRAGSGGGGTPYTGDSMRVVFAENFNGLPVNQTPSSAQVKLWNGLFAQMDDGKVYVSSVAGNNALKIDFTTDMVNGAPFNSARMILDSVYHDLYFQMDFWTSPGFNYGGNYGGKFPGAFDGGPVVDIPYISDTANVGFQTLMMFDSYGLCWYHYTQNAQKPGTTLSATTQMPSAAHTGSWVMGKDYVWNKDGTHGGGWYGWPTRADWAPGLGKYDYANEAYPATLDVATHQTFTFHLRLTPGGGYGDIYEVYKNGVCTYSKGDNRYRLTANHDWGIENISFNAFFGGSWGPPQNESFYIDNIKLFVLYPTSSGYHTTAMPVGGHIPVIGDISNKYVTSPAMPKDERYTEATGTVYSHNHAFHTVPAFVTVTKIISVVGATTYGVNMTQYNSTQIGTGIWNTQTVKIYSYTGGVATLRRTYDDTRLTLQNDNFSCDSIGIVYYSGKTTHWNDKAEVGWTITYSSNGTGSGTNPVYPSAANMVAKQP